MSTARMQAVPGARRENVHDVIPFSKRKSLTSQRAEAIAGKLKGIIERMLRSGVLGPEESGKCQKVLKAVEAGKLPFPSEVERLEAILKTVSENQYVKAEPASIEIIRVDIESLELVRAELVHSRNV